MERAGEDAHVVDPAGEVVDGGLEHLAEEGRARVGGPLQLGAVEVLGEGGARRREHGHGQVEQLAHPHAALRAGAGHRQELLRLGAGGDAADDLLLGQAAALQVPSQELVVGLGRRLEERGAEPLHLVAELRRDLALAPLGEDLRVPEVGLARHQVHVPGQGRTDADGDLQGDDLHLERGLDVGEGLAEVGLLVVEPGHDRQRGPSRLRQHVVGALGPVVGAVHRGDGQERTVGHLQRPLDLGEEGGEAGAVEHVEGAPALLEALRVQGEGEVALLLLGLGVEPSGRAVRAGVLGVGHPEERLDERGLARAVGADDGEGADHPRNRHGVVSPTARATGAGRGMSILGTCGARLACNGSPRGRHGFFSPSSPWAAPGGGDRPGSSLPSAGRAGPGT